jgi:crotonobetainyl-CoA:carnitine CoA-transferase CaiB-like acyl-CoA transferase
LPTRAAPLDGVNVLDFSQGISGPFATKFMGALGADVIKVEPPGGDSARSQPPFLGDVPHPEKSGLFLYLNTNKRSVTLEMGEPAGRAVARRLIEWADIVVEDYRPGQLAEWGLGYDEIERINPSAVLVSVTAFGQDGPYRDWGSSDLVELALGGLLYFTGEPAREPLRIGGSPAEYFGGISAFSGALLALFHADATGEGQHVDVSALESVATAQMYSALSWIYTGANRERATSSPLFRVKDGQVGVMYRQPQWGEFCRMMGHPELEHDERFKDMGARRAHMEELNPFVDEWVKTQEKQALYHRAQSQGMTWGYICNAKDLMDSPQYQHRGYFVEIDHPIAGKLTYPGMPVHWGDGSWELTRAPLLGEHNAEIYCGQLSWTPAQLVQMRATQVV